MRPLASLGTTAMMLAGLAPALGGQPSGTVLLPAGAVQPCVPTAGTHMVFVQGDRPRAAYELLMERSPTFADAIAAIEGSNAMRMRIGYPEHVMLSSERLMGEERGGAVFLADGSLFHPPGTILCGVRVVLFTKRMEEDLLRAGVPEEAVVLDLALMIAHEVFGHLIPFAEQDIPAWPTPCRDPDRRRARRTTGCAVDRENLIRQELGAPVRMSYVDVEGPLLCEMTDRSCRFQRPVITGARLAGLPGPHIYSTTRPPSPPAALPLPVRPPSPVIAGARPPVLEPRPAAPSSVVPGPLFDPVVEPAFEPPHQP